MIRFLQARLVRNRAPVSYVAALQRERGASNAANFAVKGLQHALGMSAEQARQCATAAAAAYRQLCVQGRQAGGPVPRAVLQTLHATLADGPALLALPFNMAGLRLLQQLTGSDLPLVIISNDAVGKVLAAIGAPEAGLSTIAARDVVKQVKSATPRVDGRHALYVSLPELHPHGGATCAWYRFNDMVYSASLLEPLLCCMGLSTLLTLAPCATVLSGDDLQLRALPPGGPGASKHIGPIGAWLVQHLQQAASAGPADSLAWQPLYHASAHSQQIERADKLKQLSAYLDAWHASGAGFDAQACLSAKARLKALAAAPWPAQLATPASMAA
ncbi:MAG: hypothetical protein ABW202_11430 [Duganella sp.]